MRIIESCAQCLYDKQKHRFDNEEYLAEVRKLLDERGEEDTSPLLVYRFNQVYERYCGKTSSYGEIKKKYNDLVLSMESRLRTDIENAPSPLATAMLYARIGNYIDFGAMNEVHEEVFLDLFEKAELSTRDLEAVARLEEECSKADKFLLIADNCGEIVLDKLFIEQLKKKYPNLSVSVMVRGSETLNDATMEDAVYTGIDKVAAIISNGTAIAGTVYEMCSAEAKQALDEADVILSKGQGNYESLSGYGRNIFYSFLCKCELFTSRFDVPRLTGLLVKE